MADDVALRSLSLWFDGLDGPLTPRPPLTGDTDADVVIVGGGFTGLWTAYALLERAPDLRVVVVEQSVVGSGASGRNGGWASALFAASRDDLARMHGPEGVRAQYRAMVASIDDIERVAGVEGIV